MRRLLSVLLAAGLLTLVGCGPRLPQPAETYPVQGVVLLPDGRPARGALVLFHPDGPAGSEASAELNSDGTFALKTFGEREGAVPGRYRVVLNPNRAFACSAAEKSEGLSNIPNRYWAEETTDLFAEVNTTPNTFTFRLR